MDLTTLISSGTVSTFGIFALLVIKLSDMYFASKKEDKTEQIKSLIDKVTSLEKLREDDKKESTFQHEENKKEIEELRIENKGLQNQIIQLREENGELKGIISGLSKDQRLKEKLLSQSMKKP
jgi:hypothetical protein